MDRSINQSVNRSRRMIFLLVSGDSIRHLLIPVVLCHGSYKLFDFDHTPKFQLILGGIPISICANPPRSTIHLFDPPWWPPSDELFIGSTTGDHFNGVSNRRVAIIVAVSLLLLLAWCRRGFSLLRRRNCRAFRRRRLGRHSVTQRRLWQNLVGHLLSPSNRLLRMSMKPFQHGLGGSYTIQKQETKKSRASENEFEKKHRTDDSVCLFTWRLNIIYSRRFRGFHALLEIASEEGIFSWDTY